MVDLNTPAGRAVASAVLRSAVRGIDQGYTPTAQEAEAVCEIADALDAWEPGAAAGVCPDCDGEGVLGRAADGRWISCETCGGHEDAAGSGRVTG